MIMKISFWCCYELRMMFTGRKLTFLYVIIHRLQIWLLIMTLMDLVTFQSIRTLYDTNESRPRILRDDTTMKRSQWNSTSDSSWRFDSTHTPSWNSVVRDRKRTMKSRNPEEDIIPSVKKQNKYRKPNIVKSSRKWIQTERKTCA